MSLLKKSDARTHTAWRSIEDGTRSMRDDGRSSPRSPSPSTRPSIDRSGASHFFGFKTDRSIESDRLDSRLDSDDPDARGRKRTTASIDRSRQRRESASRVVCVSVCLSVVRRREARVVRGRGRGRGRERVCACARATRRRGSSDANARVTTRRWVVVEPCAAVSSASSSVSRRTRRRDARCARRGCDDGEVREGCRCVSSAERRERG